MTEFIDTAEQLHAVQVGAVVYSSVGTIAARFDDDRGVLFGGEDPIRWDSLQLPAVVLWSPANPVPQWDPTPDLVIDVFEQLLDLPKGCVIRGVVGGVFEKFADARWYPAGGGRSISLDRLNAVLPARLIWHPKWGTNA